MKQETHNSFNWLLRAVEACIVPVFFELGVPHKVPLLIRSPVLYAAEVLFVHFHQLHQLDPECLVQSISSQVITIIFRVGDLEKGR